MTEVQAKTSVRRQRSSCSIYQVHYALPRIANGDMAKPFFGVNTREPEVREYTSQVAGHRSFDQQKYMGLLQCNNGTILKPIIKEAQRREITFYETLKSTKVKDLVELRQFVSKYYGCRKFTYNGHEMEYIILEDLAYRMLEPCIMDIKMGKRTWDPLATEEKRRNEEAKYFDSKQQYGFCIPGFQVYRGGKLLRYGKDYGKKLKGEAVKEAIRKFLNGSPGPLCRALVLQILSTLWALRRWAGAPAPRQLRLYSSSVLLVYDAARLRACCGDLDPDTSKPKLCTSAPNTLRRRSIHSMHSQETGSNFGGQISSKGPVFKKVNAVPITPISLAQKSFAPHSPTNSAWSEALERLNHSHSFENNYEDKLSKIKMNYKSLLDQLSNDRPNSSWATVKVIDFAHAFFNEENDMGVDENFKEGLDNLVAIFEEFLKETDDQVF